MTKNTKIVSMAALAAFLLLIVIFIGRDLFLRRQKTLDCGDGPRRTIDIRDFATQYSAYSVELEASIADKAKLSTKLSPVLLQQLSESMQSANEFRKFAVAGYNSCAITKTQYSQYGSRFQALDNMARQINELAARPSLSPSESKNLATLVSKYAELANRVSTE